MRHPLRLAALVLACVATDAPAVDVLERVRDRWADSDGVRIHYVTMGKGPLVVMLHGFPDYWFGWRDQMAGLARRYQVVAPDLRGYNLSDKPRGVEQYDFVLLANDVAAVIRSTGRQRATVVGHDWGGAIAWVFAALHPDLVERLVVLQTAHPRGFLRELRTNPQQLQNSNYARLFQQEGAHLTLTAEVLAGWVTDPEAKARYVEAFRRSDFEAMLAYYKRNYPRAPYADVPLPNVKAPVLVIHGLADPFILAAGHNGTWEWVDAPVTLVTVPGVGHFIQQDAAALVTRTIKNWLAAERGAGR